MSELPSMVRNPACGDGGGAGAAVISSVRSRMSDAGSSNSTGSTACDVLSCASIASMSFCLGVTSTLGGGGGGIDDTRGGGCTETAGGWRGGAAASCVTTDAGCGAPGAFGESSSAMIRRMEARISSIDGSCAFAGCTIAPNSRSIRTQTESPANPQINCGQSISAHAEGVWHSEVRTQEIVGLRSPGQ